MRNSWGFELDASGIRLMYRDGHAWTELAKERIEGADFKQRMKAMAALIENDAAADLLFPRSQILYADVQIDPDSVTRQELERVLDEHWPHKIDELDLDWEATIHGTVRVAAISLETLKEALDFASELGIRVGGFSSLADPADFPRSPNFCGRGAEVPLSSMIVNASVAKTRSAPISGIISRLKSLPGTVGHWIPQRQRAGAKFAVALAAALGIAALLWTTLPPEPATSERPLEEGPESGLASGAPQTEQQLAAPEGTDTAIDLLQLQPPVVHADAQQLSDPWRRGELQAPTDDVGIAATPLPTTLALTQPHFPPLPQAEHEAPKRVDTANGLMLQHPPVVHADARQLSDRWRRGERQAPADDAGIAAAPLPTTLALTQPHFPELPQAEHEAPKRVDTANGLMLLQPPVVHADAQQLSDPWRRGELQAPTDDVGIAAAPLPTTLALTQPHFPELPHAERKVPQRVDTAHGLLLQQPPVVHANLQQLSDPWHRGELQAPADDADITTLPLTTTTASTRPHLPPWPQTGQAVALVLDAPLPVDRSPLAPAIADRLLPHEDPPPGTKPAIDRPAYALRDTGDFPGDIVDAGPAPETSASLSPVPLEFLPRMRPDGFSEYVERLKFGGRTLAELAVLRALPRPASAQELAASSAEPSVAMIGSESSAPGMRPENFDAVVAAVDAQRRRVAAAQAQRALDAARRSAQAALVDDAEPELPQGELTSRGTPSRSTVALRATIPNAIRLNEVNLVGVYGATSDRRALVRLPSGRYVRVRVGDRVDGGRVARITESELFYQKGNRTVSLRVPRG